MGSHVFRTWIIVHVFGVFETKVCRNVAVSCVMPFCPMKIRQQWRTFCTDVKPHNCAHLERWSPNFYRGGKYFEQNLYRKRSRLPYLHVTSPLIFTLIKAIKQREIKSQCCWNVNTFPIFFQYYHILFQCLLCHSRIRTKSFNNYLGMIWFRRAWPEVDCSDDVGNREEGDGLITFKLLPINCVTEVILGWNEKRKW